jgi:hypothetical protein
LPLLAAPAIPPLIHIFFVSGCLEGQRIDLPYLLEIGQSPAPLRDCSQVIEVSILFFRPCNRGRNNFDLINSFYIYGSSRYALKMLRDIYQLSIQFPRCSGRACCWV